MQRFFEDAFKKLIPPVSKEDEKTHMAAVGEVLGTVFGFIVSFPGIIWLIRDTDLGNIQVNWAIYILFFIILLLFERFNFFVILKLETNQYGSSYDSLQTIIIWTGVFLFGPTALWIALLYTPIRFIREIKLSQSVLNRWAVYRNTALYIASTTIPYLFALRVYLWLGGSFPIQDVSLNYLLLGFAAIFVCFLANVILWAPFIFYQTTYARRDMAPLLKLVGFALVFPAVAQPFSILAAGLYSAYGILVFLFYIIGILLIAYLGHQFSRSFEHSRQQSNQIVKLEKLGRSLLEGLPDASSLPDILEEHVSDMFPSANIIIWLTPDEILYHSHKSWMPNLEMINETAYTLNHAVAYTSEENLPWDAPNSEHPSIVLAPINSKDNEATIGVIYIELHNLISPWKHSSLERLFPALHTLGDQIASALERAEEYTQSMAFQSVSQELKLAGQIQASFLPKEFPNLPGWEFAVTLEPARGLSGDYFDLIPLPNKRLGILIADVADKGFGAALYMALSRTLIRTYAFEYPLRPDIVFSETNERILSDASANLFITAFYGVLDANTFTFSYVNAGHNPPLFVNTFSTPKRVETLIRTGMPIGVSEDASWERKEITFQQGDMLVMYTDGIPDAQNDRDEFFGNEKLVETIVSAKSIGAYDMQDLILKKVREHTASAPLFDDITLMTLSKGFEED